jgi:hypothetical protein
MMSSSPEMEKKFPMDVTHSVKDEASEIGSTSHVIYIDPEKENAAFRKFDKYVVPVSFIFMLMCALDRNNVSRNNLSVTQS